MNDQLRITQPKLESVMKNAMSLVFAVAFSLGSMSAKAQSRPSIEVRVSAQEKRLVAIQAELQKQRLENKVFLGEVAKGLTNSPPSLVITSGKAIGIEELEVRVRPVQESLKKLGNDTQQLSIELEKNKREAAAAAKKAEDARQAGDKRFAEAEAKAAKHETARQKTDAEIIRLQEQLAKTKSEWSTIHSALQDRVKSLEAMKTGFDAESSKLRSLDAEVTKLKMELSEIKVKTSPDNALTGLLGVGGLAGLGALFRTLGTSRGQKQIDELFDMDRETQKVLSQMKKPQPSSPNP